MFFIMVSFCGTSNIIIHFKIKAETEEEMRMLLGLHRIGVTKEELLGIVRHKNLYYYVPQVVIGLFIGVFYNCTLSKFYDNYSWVAVGGSLLVGVILLALQLVVVRRYSRIELFSFHIG